ncbi:phasin family protein [Ancylobacter sp. MQZ15Z-1]|uniref:Phasin family protein n=1 Tax=Ancylobacter mangrovi TaxID=2972472 RepID=A0A9X2T124_9HYPH|nr:phasin family protein [Ancylobacter mangrovi]MCS0494272.1 phasin family protein [Ancylobacter mangrovi]
MPSDLKPEIPEELRTFAEQGVDQARVAIDGVIDAAHKALDDAGRQVDAAHENVREIGRTTLDFAEANIAAAFDFAARIARAQSFDDWPRLQADFVREQAARLTEQAKVLGEHGASAAAMGTPGAKPKK